MGSQVVDAVVVQSFSTDVVVDGVPCGVLLGHAEASHTLTQVARVRVGHWMPSTSIRNAHRRSSRDIL